MTADVECVLDAMQDAMLCEPREPAVPPGWAVLPAGPVRRVRVFKPEVGKALGRPVEVEELWPRRTRYYAAIEFNGPARLIHEPSRTDSDGCQVDGKVYLETEAALLVCVEPAAARAKVS
jgi:hypothetical protein